MNIIYLVNHEHYNYFVLCMILTRKIATQASPILSKDIVPWNGLLPCPLQSV